MKNVQLLFTAMLMVFLFAACNKKTSPSTSHSVYGSENKSSTSTGTTTPATVKKVKTTVPKVIVVNDNAAKKTFDGRYYYDLNGHRYWRNNKDGKYYLYNKSMNTDPNFKAP